MRIDYPGEDQLPGLRQLWKEAFGDDDSFIAAFFETGFAPDRCRCITENGCIAAALYWFDCHCGGPVAYLYAVATAKQYRGKGFCRVLMENTHGLLKELGYSGAVLVPGEPGLSVMYGSMGYEFFGGIREFSCAAAGSAQLQALSAREYAALRRQYLPAGGVIQEEANLEFLSRLVSFYAGEDFLFCADVRDGKLYCPEFLGNCDAAPRILAALGARAGSFRTPGQGDFAMYHSLSDAVAPTYFGLAFD